MDAADASAKTGVMIAYLPVDAWWCKQELPHMTLVYAGSVDDLSRGDFSSLAKDASTIATLSRPFFSKVIDVEVFGPPGEQVDVLKLDKTPMIAAARTIVERWNKSEYSFNPHATVGPVGSARELVGGPPMMIEFDKIMVAFGEESIVFKL